MIQTLDTKADFDDFLKKSSDKLHVIDFYATWCGPCKMISPVIEDMSISADYENVLFAKVDVDDNDETAEVVGIRAMPTFLFYKGGLKIDEFCGANAEKLEEKIKNHL